jgi:hypothetical protein
VITDGIGIPLAVRLTGGNRHHSTQLVPLVNALPKIRSKRGQPRQRPRWLYGDRVHDSEHHRQTLRDRHRPVHRPQEHRSRLWPGPATTITRPDRGGGPAFPRPEVPAW